MAAFLKKARDLVPDKSLRYLLHKHLSGFQSGRSFKHLHASDMTKGDDKEFCPRAFALAHATHALPADEWLTASMQMTFLIGRNLERDLVLMFSDMNKAVCHWKCVSCGHLHEFQMRPKCCSSCSGKAMEPKEVRFTSAVSDASCGIDMLVAIGHPKLRIVEIKSMDKEVFKDLKAPLSEHAWRTNLYMRIVAESGHPWANLIGTDKATIFYTTKGGYGNAAPDLHKFGLSDEFSPFKEFEISRDDSQTNGLVTQAKVLKDFKAGLAPMPHGICKTALSKRAKNCPLKGVCFSGDYPAGAAPLNVEG